MEARGYVMSIRLLAIAAILCAQPLPAFAQAYQWEDEEGNVHFSDTPPPKHTGVQIVEPRPLQNEVHAEQSTRAPSEPEPAVAEVQPGSARDAEPAPESSLVTHTLEIDAARTVTFQVPALCERSTTAEEAALKEAPKGKMRAFVCMHEDSGELLGIFVVTASGGYFGVDQVDGWVQTPAVELPKTLGSDLELDAMADIREAHYDAPGESFWIVGEMKAEADPLPNMEVRFVPTTAGPLMLMVRLPEATDFAPELHAALESATLSPALRWKAPPKPWDLLDMRNWPAIVALLMVLTPIMIALYLQRRFAGAATPAMRPLAIFGWSFGCLLIAAVHLFFAAIALPAMEPLERIRRGLMESISVPLFFCVLALAVSSGRTLRGQFKVFLVVSLLMLGQACVDVVRKQAPAAADGGAPSSIK
jgi:hypothetical protein